MRVNLSSLAFLVLVLTALLSPTYSQTAPLPLGTVTNVAELPNNGACPSNMGFLSTMTCYQASVNCPNTNGNLITFGYVSPGPSPNGTIVFFSGGGGTTASSSPGFEQNYASTYVHDNYAVVQTQWISDWEQVNWDPVQVYPYSIQNAACLPATFLHFVRYNLSRP
jgi:hypothetical protein